MHGILLVDKPQGPSSHDVVARVRRVLGLRAVGHAGTLDPGAGGLLVIAVGVATRWLPYLPGAKSYRAVLRLGTATDTEDIWGRVVESSDEEPPSSGAVREALEGLVGLKEQVPPMVSALKVDGKRLYELAREGLHVERAPRPVEISAVRVLAVEGNEAVFEVDCGPGTYVRSLCVEAGRRLGRPACMAGLRRLRACGFDVEDALPEAKWETEALKAALRDHSRALTFLEEKVLDGEEAGHVLHGRTLAAPAEAELRTLRLTWDGRLLALAEAGPKGGLRPKRVFMDSACDC
jgi:tRNA pseudouridine55 synthase